MRASVTTELAWMGFDREFINTLLRWSNRSNMLHRYNRAATAVDIGLQGLIARATLNQ